MPENVPARWNPANAVGGVTRIEVWAEGEQLADIKGPAGGIGSGVIGGSVNEKRVNGTRMSLTLTVEASRQWLKWCQLPGLEIRPWSGLSWGSSEFLCPLGRFPVLPPQLSLPRTPIQIQASDYWSWMMLYKFVVPTPAYTGQIKDAAAKLIRGARLGFVDNKLTSTANVPRVLWDKSAGEIVADMMTAVGGEAFIDRNGVPILRDRQTTPGAPLTVGEAGTITTATKGAPDYTDVINYIAVVPASTEVTFVPGRAQITDPDDPSHQSKLGQRGTTYSSPYIRTHDQAQRTAESLVQRWSHPRKSWSLTAIPDPSRMVGDRVPVTSDLGGYVVVIDEVTHDLAGGEMTMNLVAS